MKMTGAFGQGIVSGFQAGWGMVDDLKKQKEAKDAITKSAEQYKSSMMSYANQMDTIWRDGTITDEEHRDTMGLVMTLGKDFVEQYNTVYKDYKKTNLETTKRQLEEIEAAYEIYADFDFQNPEEFKQALDLLEGRTKSEDVKAKIDYIRKSIETRKGKPEAETFASYSEAREAAAGFPNAIVKFNASKGIYYLEGTKPTAPKKPTSFEEHMKEQDRMLEAEEITFEEWKADRRRLAGGAAPTGDFKTTPLPALQKMEQGMLDADTWEEAENMLRQWTGAEYNPEDVKIRKKEWTDYQTDKRTKAVESTIKQLEGLLGEKGSLRPEEEMEIYVSGKAYTRTKADWYRGLYKQYIKQLEKLDKLADIKQFKKLIAPEEIKTLGWTWGERQAGDWKTIWKD